MLKRMLTLLVLFLLPTITFAQTDDTTPAENNCTHVININRDSTPIQTTVEETREQLEVAELDTRDFLIMDAAQLNNLLIYANSDMTIDEALVVVGGDFEHNFHVTVDLVEELLLQGDNLDETDDTYTVANCNYTLSHGAMTTSCPDTFSMTTDPGIPNQPVRMVERGDVTLMDIGEGIVIALSEFEDSGTLVGQLTRPEIVFRYALEETESGGYVGTIQQIPNESPCAGFLNIHNIRMTPLDSDTEAEADDTPIEEDPLIEMDTIWGDDDE